MDEQIEIELSVGVVEYVDTGGPGPTCVFLHGLLMDHSLWDEVIADLRVDHRCIAPTLPLGAHVHPVVENAELSLASMARLVVEFIDLLDLHDVTLIGNDTGGAIIQLVTPPLSARVGATVLVSCDAFDNFPPGLTGKTVFLAGKLPRPLFGFFMQQLRLRPIRRLPIAFGWLTKRGDKTTKRWLKTLLGDRRIQRDAIRFLRAASHEAEVLAAASAAIANDSRPLLAVWATEDRVMPLEHGRRLAALAPRGQLVEIGDSYTLIPLDQPSRLGAAIRAFIAAPPGRVTPTTPHGSA